ncbi:hypothetical protein A5727_05440 [Mycobacterium sp. ACS4331]|nr:hypothetical protein A5727_05440 [Mycobacterium sp. ACS4331]
MYDTWPLVGREAELELADEVFGGGTGAGIVVAGVAGIGKTRLADAVAGGAADRGWRVQRIVGFPVGRSIPLAAFTFGADDAGSKATAEELTQGLRAQADAGGLLLVVDDAHHLDTQSRDLIATLLRSTPVKVVATVRSGEPGADGVIESFLALGLTRLDLSPLSRSAVDRLLADVLGAPLNGESAQRMWLKTQGNAMFLRHLVDQERHAGRLCSQGDHWDWAYSTELSDSLRDLVEVHIDAAGDDVRTVLDIVAVAEVLHPDLLAQLAPADAVADAVARGLIVADGAGEIRIGHPLYAEVALSSSVAELRQVRARVATAMAGAQPVIPVDPVRLGVLWHQSALPPDPDILLSAADEAARRLDTALSEHLARAAVSAGGGTAARMRHARALHYLGKGDDAAAVLDTVTDAPVRDDELDDVLMRASNLFWGLRRPDEAREVVEAALAAGATGSRYRALLVFKALQRALTGYPAAAMDIVRTVDFGQSMLHDTIAARQVEMIALGELGIEYCDADVEEYERLVGDGELASFHIVVAAGARMHALTLAGSLDKVDAVVGGCWRRCADLPGTAAAAARGIAGMASLRSGDIRAAVRDLEPARLNFDEYGQNIGMAYRYRIYYAEALAVAGRADDATEALAAAMADRHPGHAHLDYALLHAEAWVHAAHGHVSRARQTAVRAADLALSRGQRAPAVLCLQTAVAFGQTGVEATLSALAESVYGPRCPIVLRYARAVTARDGRELECVSKEFEHIGDTVAAAHAAAAATMVFRSQGLRGSALTAGDRAMDLARRCGATQGPVVAELTLASVLTGRQREVATLVARGMTNREIAAALSVTVPTIERHVRQVCVKLGARGRADLAVRLREDDPAPDTLPAADR